MGVFNVLMCSTNKCGCGVSLHFITCCYIYFLWGSHLQRQTGRSSLGREKLSQPSLCRCCWNVYFMRQHSVRTNFNGCCNTSYINTYLICHIICLISQYCTTHVCVPCIHIYNFNYPHILRARVQEFLLHFVSRSEVYLTVGLRI